MRASTEGVMDATFKVCPSQFSQLFIVTLKIAGKLWRPLCYFFMSDKYEDSYKAVFDCLKEELLRLAMKKLKCKTFIQIVCGATNVYS